MSQRAFRVYALMGRNSQAPGYFRTCVLKANGPSQAIIKVGKIFKGLEVLDWTAKELPEPG